MTCEAGAWRVHPTVLSLRAVHRQRATAMNVPAWGVTGVISGAYQSELPGDGGVKRLPLQQEIQVISADNGPTAPARSVVPRRRAYKVSIVQPKTNERRA